MPEGVMILSHALLFASQPVVQQLYTTFMQHGRLLHRTDDPPRHCTHFVLDHPDFLPDTAQCHYSLHLVSDYTHGPVHVKIARLSMWTPDGRLCLVKEYPDAVSLPCQYRHTTGAVTPL